jgi:hypothetical protein
MTLSDKPTRRPGDSSDPEFWIERPVATVEDYAQERLTPELLLGVLSLLWPDLLVHDGRVFLADTFSVEALSEWLESDLFRDHGMSAVQSVMNHVHVGDFFYRVGPSLSDEHVDFVARVMAAAWRGRLESTFPDREFRVEVRGDEISVSEP